MDSINRQIAGIKPEKPYMDWINSLPGSVEPCSIESLSDDCTAVLLPQFDFLKQSQKFIKRIYKQLFELELNGWYTDKTLWPRN